MTDVREIRRREDLPPRERAVSDALDEYLVRLHGRISGWVHPVEFLEFLAEAGLVVVPADLLTDIDKAFTNLGVCTDRDCEHPVCGWIRPTLVHRLRAALPERTTDG